MIKSAFLTCIRTPIKYIFLILILTVSFTAMCFAVYYNQYVKTNMLIIDKTFTTIAVPDTQAINNALPSPYKEDNGYTMVNFTPESDFYLSLQNFIDTCKNGYLDKRELLRGVSNGVMPVLSGTFDPLEYNGISDYPRNTAAFIGTVLDIVYTPKLDIENDLFKKMSVYSGGGTMDSAHYIIKLSIDKTIVLNSSYNIPKYVYISAGAFTSDLKCPYVIGKQYFISGVYYGDRVIQKERDNGTPFPDTYLDFDDNSVPSIYLDGSNFITSTNIISDREKPIVKEFHVDGEVTTAYTYSDKELSQMCIPYNGNMDALVKERPDITKRIDCAMINSLTLDIQTTENLNSILYFNQGKASILVGRNFTDKEITSGEPVCIVSERFATFNDLSVGDSFSVDLYNPIMQRVSVGTWEMKPYNASLINQYINERPRGSLELKIVGIYITKPFDYSSYSLNDNTIFIPSNAVPVKNENILPRKTDDLEEAEKFQFALSSHHMIPSLFSVIIPNGKLDDFMTKAEEAGYGKCFLYNDQGYSQVKDILPVIVKSSQMVILAALAGFFAVFILYLALLPRRRHELGMLISIGSKRSEAVIRILLIWIATIIPALILSFFIILFSGASLAKVIINNTIDRLQFNDIFSVGMQETIFSLSNKFNFWTSNYSLIIFIYLGIFALYVIVALIFINCILSDQF